MIIFNKKFRRGGRRAKNNFRSAPPRANKNGAFCKIIDLSFWVKIIEFNENIRSACAKNLKLWPKNLLSTLKIAFFQELEGSAIPFSANICARLPLLTGVDGHALFNPTYVLLGQYASMHKYKNLQEEDWLEWLVVWQWVLVEFSAHKVMFDNQA